MQAAVQRFIDSSISKTINVPESMSFEAFKDVYRQAYAPGCKGCTTYRPNDVTGSVLTVKADEDPKRDQRNCRWSRYARVTRILTRRARWSI